MNRTDKQSDLFTVNYFHIPKLELELRDMPFVKVLRDAPVGNRGRQQLLHSSEAPQD